MLGILLLVVSASAYSSSMRRYNLEHSIRVISIERANQTAWSVDDGRPGVLRCIIRCLGEKTCVMVLKDARSHKCSGLTAPPPSPDGSANTTAKIYTVRRQEMKQGFQDSSKSCKSGARCDNDALCYKGKCLCPPNQHYSPSAGGCRKCNPSGRTVSRYPGLGIIKYNIKWVLMIFDIDACIKQCLEETQFLCKSAEYENKGLPPHKCSLSNVTYNEVPNDSLEGNFVEWTFLARNCE